MKQSVRHGPREPRPGHPGVAGGRERPPLLQEDDVLVLTARGTKEIRDSDTSLPTPALDLLVRVDGVLGVSEIAAGMPGLTLEGVTKGLGELLRLGFVAHASKAGLDSLDFTNFFAERELSAAGTDTRKASARQAAAGLASLKRHGYFVRIARRARNPSAPGPRGEPVGVVIEDEPSLAKLLKHYLALEGFTPRVAGNRSEIVSTLGAQPAPDIVLLDVMLPDADGFDVLSRMRQHPALKSTPVIMLTAKATREAVLKGLALGADGYITKPFELDVLAKALETVLRRSGS
ncbi:MAG TPA: response regulator [Burkholderiales bacterium]|nr:response regulator [Burkholderiales bacterium]